MPSKCRPHNGSHIENIHYCDVITGTVASQITILTIVYSTVYSDADQRIHQSSASLAFVRGIFPAQMASNAENASIWWRHHVTSGTGIKKCCMMASSHGSAFRILGLCEGNPLITAGFPSQVASEADLWCFFYVSLNKQPVEQLTIWDDTTILWRHGNGYSLRAMAGR